MNALALEHNIDDTATLKQLKKKKSDCTFLAKKRQGRRRALQFI